MQLMNSIVHWFPQNQSHWIHTAHPFIYSLVVTASYLYSFLTRPVILLVMNITFSVPDPWSFRLGLISCLPHHEEVTGRMECVIIKRRSFIAKSHNGSVIVDYESWNWQHQELNVVNFFPARNWCYNFRWISVHNLRKNYLSVMTVTGTTVLNQNSKWE